MKTESVRIKETQAKILHDVVCELAGSGINLSINGMVQRGVDLFIEQELPVYLSALKSARKQLRKKEGQAVGIAS